MFFYSKFDCSLLFLNGRNVLSLSINVYEHNLCWFANFFSNVLILRAFSKKEVSKTKNYIETLSSLLLRIFIKIFIFLIYVSINTKINIYLQEYSILHVSSKFYTENKYDWYSVVPRYFVVHIHVGCSFKLP